MRPRTLLDLPWLPQPSADFRARCKALDAREGPVGRELRALGTAALRPEQLRRLGKSLQSARARDAERLAPLTPFRLGLVSNATTDLLVPCLEGSALRFGLALEVVVGGFGQVEQEILDPQSELIRSAPDAVLFALDHRAFELGASAPGAASDRALERLLGLQRALRDACGATSIVQTVPPPAESLFGHLDRQIGATARACAEALNAALVGAIEGSGDLLLDIAHLAATAGLDQWHDPVQWNVAKLAFAQSAVPLYADHVARTIAALRGKSRKCLVLDLDNTLWGGVIGDDGLSGITLGEGDPDGEAFLDVQRTARALRERGIVLAVCSKNEHATALSPFRDHPEMLLREEDIAVFVANWRDKASNLESIAGALNLGVDALVLLDDNPVERAQVREALPEVAVPELPDEPAHYARTLLAAGYFDATSFTDEDRQRAESYRAEASRKSLEASHRNLDDFHRSLEMRAVFTPFRELDRKRITQLINKTNQFNLTTRRYTEAEVTAFEQDPHALTLCTRLRDRFGDNGLISIVIGRRDATDPTCLELDTWLMSCRVLGRRVEEAVLDELVRRAEKLGVERLRGRYVRTERNALVADHYRRLGFACTQEGDDAAAFELALGDYAAKDPPIAVEAAP